ncbi:MAG TPA: FumA C-terminus/TtdB family hydratase beta subunit [Bacteroidales bacterium]|nr:FumA C-terminus/TtdB family hydratase beta subunit [Bacteroidales bacterium]HQG37256.1 FumA C-terminus/TtdB family hydratase beta subunit [Bacteroidales bacterium]HQG53725.1 FumA C-terminus/TtdB family hydratase beta subunit [Bacteroidales bacterium]HQJ21354.1 FumA C-terminus/TtdB family hydratase beta subunit [Bacteroidales bacterium]
MADFIYEEIFQRSGESIGYRLLTKDYVETIEYGGRKILKVNPEGLVLLASEAINEISFFMRSSHLEKLRQIIDDPEASANDKFVAYTMLKNSVISAEGDLPWCQDTGTTIVLAKKGEDVYTGGEDALYISKGIYETYRDKNLRYSQIIPLSMFEEENSGTNLPAQIEIFSNMGNVYEFLFIAKGGGSANKVFLYQESKTLLNEESLEKFVKEKIRDIGTSACPPYYLALVIGGLSAEMTLETVKEASAGYLDNLPVTGSESGRAFRDIEWEKKIEKICREYGVGAQFGGKYFVHDVRVIRLPRHAASCPVGMGVSCSAHRNIQAKITQDGIFIEKLERNPDRFMPAGAPEFGKPIEVNLNRPVKEIIAELSKYPLKTRLNLTGTLVVARDMAHARIKKMVEEGKPIPEYFKDHPIYYAGPAKTPEGMISGSFGPTTAGRMDDYVELFQSLGGSLVMIAKGERSREVVESCKKYGGFYLGTIGGAAAIVAKENIKSVELVDFEDLGMEAVRKIYVENMPAFILIDDKGNNFFDEYNK